MKKFEGLAKRVADEFRKTMKVEEFESFEEMKRCYGWEWADVKDEVDYCINEIAREDMNSYLWMADDHTFIQYGIEDIISWREFKKLLLTNLNAEESEEE